MKPHEFFYFFSFIGPSFIVATQLKDFMMRFFDLIYYFFKCIGIVEVFNNLRESINYITK